ncbi:hypothetical protein LILAB_34770 [Corallococcus macrosporus]|uniref:Uncharacterized protein n=1 Tax=Myxococcus fulvus (strain ATCC BAA-855 / HW-1) TaxID=483219 RepID=F8CJ53_MYXFH|nr:hypothetical protein LILAB_34770 [Corallococcus macrosporus]
MWSTLNMALLPSPRYFRKAAGVRLTADTKPFVAALAGLDP